VALSRRVTVVGGDRLTGELLASSLRRHGLFETSWQHEDAAAGRLDDQVVAVLVDPAPNVLRAAHERGALAVAVVTAPSVSLNDEIGLVLSGADAVIRADTATDEVVRRLQVVDRGGALVAPGPLRTLLDRVRQRGARVTSIDDLTPREQQILKSIDRGESVKQTARVLGISPKTVENLQSRLFSKLDVRNRAQAVSHAHGLGLLDDVRQGADEDDEMGDEAGSLPT
jgi:DNA-binding NarL/FixJ family response regulator